MTFIDAWLYWLLSLSAPGAQNVEAPRAHVHPVARVSKSHTVKARDRNQRVPEWSHISADNDDDDSAEIGGRSGGLKVVSQISNGY